MAGTDVHIGNPRTQGTAAIFWESVPPEKNVLTSNVCYNRVNLALEEGQTKELVPKCRRSSSRESG